MGRYKDLTGQRFGRLIVISQNGRDEYKRVKWKCLCDCGAEITVQGGNLTSGNTKSCGCLSRENLSKGLRYKHGLHKSSMYVSWHKMKQRCSNPNDNRYQFYGYRGITVCSEWQEFQNFHDWAINNGYQEGLTIDRIDVNGGYCPNNCRWATVEVQANNKSNNVTIEFNGKVQSLSKWSDEMKIPYATLYARIEVYHWSIEKALTTPVRKHKG